MIASNTTSFAYAPKCHLEEHAPHLEIYLQTQSTVLSEYLAQEIDHHNRSSAQTQNQRNSNIRGRPILWQEKAELKVPPKLLAEAEHQNQDKALIKAKWRKFQKHKTMKNQQEDLTGHLEETQIPL